jgi:hypothetical protein
MRYWKKFQAKEIQLSVKAHFATANAYVMPLLQAQGMEGGLGDCLYQRNQTTDESQSQRLERPDWKLLEHEPYIDPASWNNIPFWPSAG